LFWISSRQGEYTDAEQGQTGDFGVMRSKINAEVGSYVDVLMMLMKRQRLVLVERKQRGEIRRQNRYRFVGVRPSKLRTCRGRGCYPSSEALLSKIGKQSFSLWEKVAHSAG